MGNYALQKGVFMHMGKGILVAMLVSLGTLAIVTRVAALRKIAGLE